MVLKMDSDILQTLQVVAEFADNSSESSSSSSDEEDYGISIERNIRSRILNYENVIRNYSDVEFKSHFRLTRTTFTHLIEIIRDDLLRIEPGYPTIPSHLQLMIALWKMGTMDSYRSVCDRFNVGRATAVRSVRRVTEALFKQAPSLIQWPTGQRALDVMEGFERANGFPRVIGAIDGTHIAINAPRENPADYVNRKGFHSIHLQIVCDHQMMITHCYAGHPGSVHDQRVFRRSEVVEYLNEDHKFPLDSHILGDSAYEIHQHLITPYRNNGHLTRRQTNFNYRHSSTRMVVERCIGTLKGRMRSLLHCLPMTRIDLMAKYIIACCVLHNICISRGDIMTTLTISGNHEENNSILPINNSRNSGIHKRDTIMNSLAI